MVIFNKKGLTFVEIMIAVVLMLITAGVGLGAFTQYMNNVEAATANLISKIEYTQQIGKNRDSSSMKTMPYIKLSSTDMEFINEDDKKAYNYRTNKYANDGSIKVETDIPDGIIYFDENGYPVDKNGNYIKDAHIYLTKGNNTKTIRINCEGKITSVMGKDTSVDSCVISGNTIKVNETLVCKDNEEIKNGACVPICKDDEKLVNGICQPKCPNGFIIDGNSCKSMCSNDLVYNSQLDTCACPNPNTQDLWNGGKCIAKCGAHEHHNNTLKGECVCDEGYGRKNGVCVIKSVEIKPIEVYDDEVSYCPDVGVDFDTCENAGEAVTEYLGKYAIYQYSSSNFDNLVITINGKEYIIPKSSLDKIVPPNNGDFLYNQNNYPSTNYGDYILKKYSVYIPDLKMSIYHGEYGWADDGGIWNTGLSYISKNNNILTIYVDVNEAENYPNMKVEYK